MSQSLLTSGTLDQGGTATNGDYYVTTDSGGNFSISGDYTCTAGQQVYLYSLGGDPGLGTGANAAAGLMAALGSCPTGGNFLSGSTPISYIVVNEVSTVAAAYAMAGFATDATHVGSSGTALALTGIANAFANAANLETISTGVALATTPAGNGAVPQAEINTLANILAACVNSNGSLVSPAPCYQLEIATRVSSFDTAKAAISIAQSPVTNVAELYALSSSTPPFAPALTAQPKDWTVQISFTGGGLTLSFSTLAIDGNGDAWVAEYAANGAIELSSTGAILSGTGGYSGSGFLTSPQRVAIDPSGNAWFTGGGTPGIVEFSGAGGFLGSYDVSINGGGSVTAGANGIVVDGSGNVWVPTFNDIAEFGNSGLLVGVIPSSAQWDNPGGYAGGAADSSGNVWVAPYFSSTPNFLTMFSTAANGGTGYLVQPGGGLDYPWAIAIDGSGNGWVTNNVGNSVSKVSSAGVALSPSSGFTAGAGLVAPYCLSVDGAGNVWVGADTSENIVEFNNSGILLSGGSGLRTGDQNPILSIAVDGSGDVWTTVDSNSVNEIIGVAAPVVTPLSVGAKNNMLGTRP
jgi:hypothetical protein